MLDDGETKTGSATFSRIGHIDTIKPFGNAIEMFLGYAQAFVVYLQAYLAVVCIDPRYFHRLAVGAVAQSIGD